MPLRLFSGPDSRFANIASIMFAAVEPGLKMNSVFTQRAIVAPAFAGRRVAAVPRGELPLHFLVRLSAKPKPIASHARGFPVAVVSHTARGRISHPELRPVGSASLRLGVAIVTTAVRRVRCPDIKQ